MGEKLMTTREVCERYGVSRRTVMNWAAAGGVKIIKRRGQNGGRPKNYFNAAELEEFVVANKKAMPGASDRAKKARAEAVKAKPKRGRPSKAEVEAREKEKAKEKRQGRKSRKRGAAAETRQRKIVASTGTSPVASEDESGKQTSPGAGGDGDGLTGEDLPEILARLKSAETRTHALWKNAIEANEECLEKRLEPMYGAAAMKNLQDNWKAMVEMRRKFEKDLPTFMKYHGRYVDIDVVAQVWSRVYGATNSELDQIGISIAEECVGRSAGEIRLVIDRAIKDAKLHIGEGWNNLVTEMER